jgi:hypothetical protein
MKAVVIDGFGALQRKDRSEGGLNSGLGPEWRIQEKE